MIRRNNNCRYNGQEATERAKHCHEEEYNPVNNSDEHFVTRAKTGQAFQQH